MAAMNTWTQGQPGGGEVGAGGSYYTNDTNPQGAAADPFAYTQGSLLTPWQGRFSSAGYSTGGGGGYTAPSFTPFNYADFGYNAPSAGRFTENYADPAAFRFADYAGPSEFQAPTAEDMKADPGYQARMDAVRNAQVAGAAHGGALRSGGFQKGLAQAVGNQASQEYGNVYNRRAAEYAQRVAQAKDVYGINQGNTKQAFDTNTANLLAAHNTRQNDWSGNANVALQEGQLGYNIAQGTWDRNEQKARQGWEDEAAHQQALAAAANANASASSASANQAYERDLADYNRARDEFWTNEDRQTAQLGDERNFGYNAANTYANQLMGGYGQMGNYAVGAGDARASGIMGAAQSSPWGSALDAAGTGLMYAGMSQSGQDPRQPAAQPPSMSVRSGLGGLMPGTMATGPGQGYGTLPSRQFSGYGYAPGMAGGVMGGR